MASSFGEWFRITSFGESHGPAVGVVIDGCPSGHKIELERVAQALQRRRPGQSHLASPRRESDTVSCLSGLSDGYTLGSPITLIVHNENVKPQDYSDLQKVFRPSHADYTFQAKYGIRASSGGGRASARETIARVAAAAIAEQILEHLIPGFSVVAWVNQVKDIKARIKNPEAVTRDNVDTTAMRCPDDTAQKSMQKLILDAKSKGDSVGGAIYCGIKNCPAGLGEPIFDKLEADLAKAMMSLPASKGFEIGSGFSSMLYYGSEHNDAFTMEGERVRTTTNHSGGIQGGISNGEYIYMQVAFKPVATIFKKQQTVDESGQVVHMKPKAGRHDPCVLPRAVPIVEAMATLVIMDHFLRQKAWESTRPPVMPS